jgi:hypothetical protein
LVNGNGFSIHHATRSARFYPVAFIFDEWRAHMVNRWCAAASFIVRGGSGVNPMLNRICVKLLE